MPSLPSLPFPHTLTLTLIVVSTLPHTVFTRCSFPSKMAGTASDGPNNDYKFSIDLEFQLAVFRDYKNTALFSYYDFNNHKKHQKFADGSCVTTGLHKSLRLPKGVTGSWDSEIASEYPPSPALPRKVKYNGLAGDTFQVWMYDDLKCTPEEWPFFAESPGQPIATKYTFNAKSRQLGYNIHEDLSQCVPASG